jgi:hypothetical protein
MNKDEALEMAIELMERFLDYDGISSSDYIDVRDACKEALDCSVKQTKDGDIVHNSELKELVRSFFDDYLNTWERRQDGSIYRPISIGCGRVMKMEPLGELLEKMRELSEAQPPYEEKKDE